MIGEIHRMMGGLYEVHCEVGSGAMMYIQSFIKIGSSIQKLMGRDSELH
jgi:hypothetical protein